MIVKNFDCMSNAKDIRSFLSSRLNCKANNNSKIRLALFLHHFVSQYVLYLLGLFQGFEARGTEIRGRQGALDNIKSVILDYRFPYDISVNYKNFNYNEQLFGKRWPEYGIAYGAFFNKTEDSVNEDRRRRRSVPEREVNWEDFLRIIRTRGSSNANASKFFKPDHFRNIDKAQLEDEKENMGYPQHIADVRQKRQTSEIDCINRRFSKIYLFRKSCKKVVVFFKRNKHQNTCTVFHSFNYFFVSFFFQKRC